VLSSLTALTEAKYTEPRLQSVDDNPVAGSCNQHFSNAIMSSFSDAPQLGATFAPGGDEYHGVPVVLTDTMSPLTPVEDNG
jgi:hypothetical protein